MFSVFRKKPPVPGRDWRVAGNEALGRGDLAEAERCYREATRAEPDDAAAWLNLGFVQFQVQQLEDAQASLERSLALSPQGSLVHDAHFLLGQLELHRGQVVAAMDRYQSAVAAKPDFVEALSELARLGCAEQRWPEALAWAQRLRALAPSALAALLEARALHALARHADALAALDAALVLEPGNADALEGRGNVLQELKRPEEALACFQQALALRGPTPEGLSNGAGALAALGRMDEALSWNARALALQPEHRSALFNQSQLLLEANRPGEALAVATHGARLYPEDKNFAWNCAYALLTLGDFRQGWPAYEARWHAPVLGPRQPAPGAGQRWTGGADLAGRTLLVFSEQGLGDSIQFVRFVPEVARKAARVYLQIQPALLPLLQALPDNCELLAPGQPLPRVDFECPMLSLPLALGTDWDTLPRELPYVQVDEVRRERWATRMREPERRLRVGLAWSGRPEHPMDHKRSIPLALMQVLAANSCQFISLQKELRSADEGALQAWTGLQHFGSELGDFGDTAALASQMDLVIAVDTSIAHLAGALGRPTWILLAHAGEWRWLQEREDSPWYPTARLYRQDKTGDWARLLARAAHDLAAFEAQWRASTGA